jgi:hypothetical protein
MRKLVIAFTFGCAAFAASAFVTPAAQAAPLPAPAGVATALDQTGLVQQAAYVCRRVWRCRHGYCGWRRVCWWQPSPYYGYDYYGPRRDWYWRHHHPYRRW